MPRGMRMSAIDKRPLDGPVFVGTLGLAGDEQAERRFHGGPLKAVYVYALEDLAWWSEQLGRSLPPGFIGENVTTAEIDVNGLRAGDELHIGAVILRATEPRVPCAKLTARIGVVGFERRFGQAARTGVYCAVAAEGSIAVGDAIAIVRAGAGPDIRTLVAAQYRGVSDRHSPS